MADKTLSSTRIQTGLKKKKFEGNKVIKPKYGIRPCRSLADESSQNAVNCNLQTIKAIEKLDTFVENCTLIQEGEDIQLEACYLINGQSAGLHSCKK